MKLAIGTVQFGMDYGISNKKGRTQLDEVQNIFKVAKENGIITIDTAPDYGNSEKVIGRALNKDHYFSIITKTILIGKRIISKDDTLRVRKEFLKSLRNLNRDFVDGLLIHYPQDFLAVNGTYLIEELRNLKQKGFVKKIGASVYKPDEVVRLLDLIDIDLIQLPMNIFDQRFLKTGLLKILKNRGVEIHVRSAFLQGLLMMEPSQLPSFFDQVKKPLENLHEDFKRNNIRIVDGLLGFLWKIPEIDRIICGLNNVDQLNELITVENNLSKIDDIDFDKYQVENEQIIIPSNWKF